ncbi:hypothetical protein ABZ876_12175 [Streptomyces sp. NPDC046931]|uniref:hypothetical protein n=1 Tax=Streptomyces sp. NPDC046931 TaxID=3154806 RepID=UPI00340C5565
MQVAPVADETTWSFLHRVGAAYRLGIEELLAGWRWVNPVTARAASRPRRRRRRRRS